MEKRLGKALTPPVRLGPIIYCLPRRYSVLAPPPRWTPKTVKWIFLWSRWYTLLFDIFLTTPPFCAPHLTVSYTVRLLALLYYSPACVLRFIEKKNHYS